VAALPERAAALLAGARAGAGRVVVLTGAGISAESGIPTFRGPGGYWRVGSVDYRPEELATLAAFTRMPAEQWGWYLHRRAVCAAAQPNAAHQALVRLEKALADRFLLVANHEYVNPQLMFAGLKGEADKTSGRVGSDPSAILKEAKACLGEGWSEAADRASPSYVVLHSALRPVSITLSTDQTDDHKHVVHLIMFVRRN